MIIIYAITPCYCVVRVDHSEKTRRCVVDLVIKQVHKKKQGHPFFFIDQKEYRKPLFFELGATHYPVFAEKKCFLLLSMAVISSVTVSGI